jgi:LPXTG-motif cell wall-anchored protein
MNFKNIGVLLVIIGVLMILYTGFNYVTTEEIIQMGPIQLKAKTNHPVQWSPIVGAALLLVGVLILVFKKVKSV